MSGSEMEAHEVQIKTYNSDNEHDADDDSMDMPMPTTVTIVEEDGSTSIVEDAAVSSILTDTPSSSTLQFAQTQGGVTYRVVGIADDGTAYTQSNSGIQVITSPSALGSYYVLNGQDILGSGARGARLIRSAPSGSKAGVRDEKKRATHNEVERRRRDKINGWINKLAKIVPHTPDESGKASQSKGGILAKACEYIHELRSTNVRLASTLKEHENTAEELDALRREISELRRENNMLKQQLGPTELEEATVIISSECD